MYENRSTPTFCHVLSGISWDMMVSLVLRVIIFLECFTGFDPLFDLTGHPRPMHRLSGPSKASFDPCVLQVHVLLDLWPHCARDHKSITAEDETICYSKFISEVVVGAARYGTFALSCGQPCCITSSQFGVIRLVQFHREYW